MKDFAAAFHAGQTAAKNAEFAKGQIEEVLKAVASSLLAVTNGKLNIYAADSTSAALALFAATQSLNRLTGKSDPAPVKEQSIFARNVLAIDKTPIRIARWTVPHEGFPCVLGYSGQEVRCHDRLGLETAFADLLADPWVGEQLGRLLALEIREPLSDGDFEPI